MENRERYKRLIMFLASAFILTLQTGVFAYVWFKDYAFSGAIGEAFWKRGNYVVIAQYALMLYFFYRIYGGFKVGYLRVFEVLYSQVLSVLCVNAITYLQLALIGRWKFTKFIEPIRENDRSRSGDRRSLGRIYEVDLYKNLSAETDAAGIWRLQPAGSDPEDFQP